MSQRSEEEAVWGEILRGSNTIKFAAAINTLYRVTDNNGDIQLGWVCPECSYKHPFGVEPIHQGEFYSCKGCGMEGLAQFNSDRYLQAILNKNSLEA